MAMVNEVNEDAPHIVKFQALPLLTRTGRQRKIRLLLSGKGLDDCQAAICRQEREICRLNCRDALPGSILEFYLPEPEAAIELTIELQRGGMVLDQTAVAFHPVKQWRIPLVLSSHEDLGYVEYANRLPRINAHYLDRAMNLADGLAASGEPPFRYVIEHYAWLSDYCATHSRADVRRLQAAFSAGTFELIGIHSGVHTHWHSTEQLARAVLYTQREARDQLGISAVTLLLADLSGAAWPVVTTFADAGIRYLVSLPNGARNIQPIPAIPPFFWWEGPDQHSRLLCNYQNHYRNNELYLALYNALTGMREYAAAFGRHVHGGIPLDYEAIWDAHTYPVADCIDQVADALANIILAAGDTPVDLLPVYYYFDHECPNMLLHDIASAMNRRYQWPHLDMGLPQEYFPLIEEGFGDKLPVLRGDWNDQWADYLTINPTVTAAKRQAADLLPIAETLSLLAHARRPDFPYPADAIHEALWRLSEFDEHCWPTMIPDAPMHRLNTALVKIQSAAVAANVTGKLLQDALQILDQPTGPAGQARQAEHILARQNLLIWNVIPRERQARLRLPAGSEKPSGLPVQILADGTILTAPVSLPAFGAISVAAEPPETYSSGFMPIGSCGFETPFYIVRLDPESGCLRSLIDKQSAAEWIDADAAYAFAGFVYVENPSATSPELSCSTAAYRLAGLETGPLAVVVRTIGWETRSQADITCSITFYKDSPDIDVTVAWQNAADFLGGYEKRYRRSIFLAFPFAVNDGSFITELSHGVMRGDERLHITTEDFVVCRHWVAVQNDLRGVAVFSRGQPVFHLGGIHYNQFAAAAEPESSAIYLYAASNRTSGLYPAGNEDCQATFALSVRPYAGTWQEQIPAWSLACAYPPIVTRGQSAVGSCSSFFRLQAGHTNLTAVKQDERPGEGLIIRFQETVGCAETVRITLPWIPDSAEYATLAEDGTGRFATCQGNEVTLEIGAFCLVTLLLRSRKPDSTAPLLSATAVGDAAIVLNWSAVPGTLCYLVCAGDTADVPLNRVGLIGSCTGTTFQETALEPFRRRYYRVMAVTPWNEAGPPSNMAAAITLGKNQTAPSPAGNPFAVTIDEHFVLVCWKQPPEQDIANYAIERSDGTAAAAERGPDAVQFYEDHAAFSGIRYRVIPIDVAGNRNEQAVWFEPGQVPYR